MEKTTVGVISTEAWVLRKGPVNAPPGFQGEFKREEFSFLDISEEEVLAEPLYGCWEGNMTHAITRDPVDICRIRREETAVLGNAGLVRVKRVGNRVKTVKEDDLAIFVPIGAADPYGYLTKVTAFDAPKTMGLLAKQMKTHESNLAAIPKNTHHSIKQWAAFSLRYMTAWANWKVAYGCWRLQMPEYIAPISHVCSWGGGVGLAEVTLAKQFGCRVAMIASTDERLCLIKAMGIEPIDRRQFPHLDFNEERFQADRSYRIEYLASERIFLSILRARTDGMGVSIFIDNIGRPVFRASLRALGRQGIITSVGWKHGHGLSFNRAVECIQRHIHVYTHGASHAEGLAAGLFAEATGWMPPESTEIYTWNQISQLADDFANERIRTYFPLYEVNSC
jgi:NADPH:quinone reductase-like Zn-dependent oxidoreductase